MTRTIKYKDQIDNITHSLMRKYPDIIISERLARGDVTARTFVSLTANNAVKQAGVDSPNIFGLLNYPVDAADGDQGYYVTYGPALTIAKSKIVPNLPIKVSAGGKIVNGIINQAGSRVIITATSGLDGEITDPDSNDELLTIVSDDTADTTQMVYVYVKEKTTGTAKMLQGKLNGTTAVTLVDAHDIATQIYADEVYGLRKSASSAGSVVLKNATTGTTLITAAAGNDTRGLAAITNATYAYYRQLIATVSVLGADDIFIAGESEDEVAQYEIIASAAANAPLVRQSIGNWGSVDYLVVGKFAAARTVALNGIPSNEWELDLVNNIADATYTDGSQPGNGAAEKPGVKSDEAVLDVGQKITIIGYDYDTSAVVIDEVTLNGTTLVMMNTNVTHVYAAYVSEGTVKGEITIENVATADILVWDALTLNSAGLLLKQGGTTGTGPITAQVFNGANARPVITLSNAAATDRLIIVGEDEYGTVNNEMVELVNGVFELVNEYSIITHIAGATLAATEYLKISHEQEDDASSFIGTSVNGANATDAEVEIFVKCPAFPRARGKAADAVLMQEIIGPRGKTQLDTIASATRIVNFPDLAGNVVIMGTTGLVKDNDGNTKQSTKFICGSSDGTVLSLSNGGSVVALSAAITNTSWAVGDWSMGAATRGYWDMDLKAEYVTVAIPLPELAVDTGVAADLRLGFRLDPTNADDVIDYAVYTQDGTALVDEINQTISGATEATKWINLGALAWSKGDHLIVTFGIFATAADADVDVKVYWLELEAKTGIDNDVA